jgi:hypothetical protein
MEIVLIMLILSNLALWFMLISLIDIVKRNEAMTDSDREINNYHHRVIIDQIEKAKNEKTNSRYF